ncbi:MAG: helix-turn-helix domain-containing protein [Chloroflexota bacterium]
MNPERAPEIMTPEQVAEYLQLDRETIYRYIRGGQLVAPSSGGDIASRGGP